MSKTKVKVLCVDDEPQVLEGLALQLHRGYDVHTATSGEQGLEELGKSGPFAVVLSDMRMPNMNGAAFLSQVRQRAPDAVRMLLTGYAELDAAIAAVNEGQIFRFLTKPCPTDQLRGAFDAAAEQHRLIMAERELLEKTLRGSLQTLSETLALAKPELFGRAQRIRGYVQEVAEYMNLGQEWYLDVASMLSQIPYVTLPEATMEKISTAQQLDASEQQMLETFPDVIESLLSPIPRIEEVRRILRYQAKNFDGSGIPADSISGEQIPMGSRILKIVTDYDALDSSGMDNATIFDTMQIRKGYYDPDVLSSFAETRGAALAREVVELPIKDIRPGMVIAEDIQARTGTIIIARGHEVTPRLLQRLQNFASGVGIKEPMRMFVPRSED